MRYCEHCGAKLDDEQVFCEKCGTQTQQSENTQVEDRVVSEPIQESSIPQDIERTVESETSSIPSNEDQLVSEVIQEEGIPQNIGDVSEIETSPVLSPQPSRKGKAKKLVVFGSVFILLLLSSGGFFFFRHYFNSKTPVAQSDRPLVSTSETREIISSTTSSQMKTEESNDTEQKTDKEKNSEWTPVTDFVSKYKSSLPLNTGIYISSVDDKVPYTYNDELEIRSASVIKLFILTAYFNQVKNQTIYPEAMYTLAETDKVGGTGVLQYRDAGFTVRYQDLARHMIIDSDNTAGNILIRLLGGPEVLTKWIQEQGYTHTRIERYFLDADALDRGKDNYTSAQNVAELLKSVYNRQLISPEQDQQFLDILSENKDHAKIPLNLPSDIDVYNKTGVYPDYGVQNDACILANKQIAYVVVMLSSDGQESQQNRFMNDLGLLVYDQYLR